MKVAKVFKNGRSQAIRLPKEFRVNAEEVMIEKTDVGFHVITKDPWVAFDEGVTELSDEFLNPKRSQPSLEF